jgi:hypothetical protein
MSFYEGRELVVTEVIGYDVIIKGFVNHEGYRRSSTSLCGLLRYMFNELIPSDQNYCRAFDTFDMLWGLVYLDQHSDSSDNWEPGSSVIYESRSWESLKVFWKQASKQREEFPILKTGLFDGKTGKLREALRRFVQFAQMQQSVTIPDYAQIYQDNSGRGAWIS